jgi:NAD(P)H dehydrogenase (quinone)
MNITIEGIMYRPILVFTRFFLFLSFLAGTSVFSQTKTVVLVVFYSEQGHTKEMAEAVAGGAAKEADVTVVLKSVKDATTKDVLAADAIIVGSPVFNGAVAPQVQEFINSWPFKNAPLKDKIGAAFATGGGISSGEEFVQMGILRSMMIFGMIVAGGPDWTTAFGASAVTGEAPFESQNMTLRPQFAKKGELLGQRIAQLARRMRKTQ